MSTPNKKPWGLSWEVAVFAILLLYPLFPVFESNFFNITRRSLGDQLPTVFIFAILALGLNVVVGYTGMLHLGIAGFFAIGAYVAGILMAPSYTFGANIIVALILGPLIAGLAGFCLGAPTLRLRGDYLALTTLGFGEVVRYALRNLGGITAGTQGLSPIPPPPSVGDSLDWIGSYVPWYYLTLIILIGVMLMLRNLENSRLGRAWIALREDELAANCMGLNPGKLKLAAFALGAAIAGLAGVLYANRLTSTSAPDAYSFNRSVFILCCLILGGLGSRRGVLLGVFLLVGFDNIVSPIVDTFVQSSVTQDNGDMKIYKTFSGWRLIIFGLALILMMRFRPEGLIPSSRVKHELHPDELVQDEINPVTLGNSTEEINGLPGGRS
ncbi:MAG: branched-chain amino acid ABC transporter permease [Fimbriiglobus sp.]